MNDTQKLPIRYVGTYRLDSNIVYFVVSGPIHIKDLENFVNTKRPSPLHKAMITFTDAGTVMA